MAVRRDPERGWVVDFMFIHADGRKQRVRKRSPVSTKRGAERYEREMREALQNPPAKPREVPTLKKYSKYLMEHAINNNKFTEQLSKKYILARHLLPAFGRTRLNAINRRQIESYKARKLKDGYSPKTINNQLTVLRKTLSLALEDEIIDHIPPIKWLKVPQQGFDFLDFDEADRLIEAARPEPLWHAMIMVGVRTGLRQGELLALRWDDVDLVSGRLVVRRRIWRGDIDTPKGGRNREIPLSPQCLETLKAYRHLRGELVFCHEDGTSLSDGQCKRPIWNICKLAGLRRIGWQVLRHTFCSHLVMLGVTLKVVQEYAGHTDIRITMRYAHLSPEVGRDAVALLDRKPTKQSHGTNVAQTYGHICNDLKSH